MAEVVAATIGSGMRWRLHFPPAHPDAFLLRFRHFKGKEITRGAAGETWGEGERVKYRSGIEIDIFEPAKCYCMVCVEIRCFECLKARVP